MNARLLGTLIFLFVILGIGGARAVEPSAPAPGSPKTAAVDFVRDIKPILSNNCFACHGPDPKTRKAKLRLDLREEAVKAAKSGTGIIVPGKSSESELVKRILATAADEIMPPPKSHKTLSAVDKELLKRWIDEGAEYKMHWSLVKPVRPDAPKVKNTGWVKNEIDAFVLNKLEAAGLAPGPEADRATFIRRLSLDLRGFSPSIQEVDEFLADQSSDAYEKLVERMLASPRYGEKMAQQWLDAARFGDTSGYHYDSTRQMWLWRDYVIDSFNKNKPFDQFTVEQLAGDLLPNATNEHKIATGFNRNTRFNEEGGADPEEFVVRYNVDRVNTLGQVWLGLTLGCAECHSHKYDPISQKEYYQLYAFFNSIKEPMVSMNHNKPLPPLLKVASLDQTRSIENAKHAIAAAEARLTQELAKVHYEEPAGAAETAAKPEPPKDVVWVEDDAPKGAKLLGDGKQPWQWVGKPKQPVLSGAKSMKRSGPGLHQHFFLGAEKPLTLNPGDKLFAHVWLDPKDPPKSVQLQFHDADWNHRAYWGDDLCFGKGETNGPGHHHVGPLPKTGEWVRLEVAPEAVGLKAGAKLIGLAFTQFDGTVYYDQAGVNTVSTPNDRHLLSQRAWEERDKNNAALPADVRAALKLEPEKRSEAQKSALRVYYLRNVFAGTKKLIEPIQKEIDDHNKKIQQFEKDLPTTMISEEMKERKPAFVLMRGDFQQRGEAVQPEVPAVFPPLPEGQPKNRLGLARWLVAPDHPLTSRVIVNRLWLQLFGSGIVRSPGDFGTQGDFPSHPELLDWLATEFIRTGWNIKDIQKKILLSATYRQSSAFTAQKVDIDPNNRLLYRAPRFRLSAEEIRDNALSISGLLSARIGGPSVMPYQPADFYKGKNENWKWNPSNGEDQYRRGLYTFWRRTSLHPMFTIFDAPSREECVVCRPRTNTPLQALATLNDPTFVEAARVFAQKVLTQGPADTEGRIAFAFRAALTRAPTPAEVQVLDKNYKQLLERYKGDAAAAAKVVKAGSYPAPPSLDVADHAAWTALANILLNLDETITRE